MTPDVLVRIGEALYGPRWKTDLADALGVTPKTVQHWLNGRMRPRPGVWVDLAALMDRRIEEIKRVRAEILI